MTNYKETMPEELNDMVDETIESVSQIFYADEDTKKRAKHLIILLAIACFVKGKDIGSDEILKQF